MNSQRTRDIGEVWEDPKCKGFSPVVLGCTPLPAHAHQPGTSLHPPSTGILWKLHRDGMINYRLHFQPLSPLWRMRSSTESSKFLIVA